jgi:hypothetical protein
MAIPDDARVHDLAELPIDVVEAMYSPDFVELVTLTAGGLPMVLPMSFTLDVPGNCVRFSSPLTAARLVHLSRDPRCAVSFSRVTSGYPPALLQGVATLGEVAEGVRRGPARRFTVAPHRLFVHDEPPRVWDFLDEDSSAAEPPAAVSDADERRSASAAPLGPADLDTLTAFPTTVVALRDRSGWPFSLPVEPEREGDTLAMRLPAVRGAGAVPGPSSLLGHTWTRDGPRFLVLTGRATIDGATLRFTARRALRRG